MKNTENDTDLFSSVIAVTNRRLCARPFPEQIERVCRLHPKGLIVREKDLTEAEYARLFCQVMEICDRYQVPCICHTYIQTAKDAGCRQIHLPLPLLKSLSASGKLEGFDTIGVSVHSAAEAADAEKTGRRLCDCRPHLPDRLQERPAAQRPEIS